MFPIRNFAVDIGLKLDRWPMVRGWEQLSCDAFNSSGCGTVASSMF